jgi:hypothetical protein
MKFTQPILSLQYELKGIEQSIGELGEIDCLNEYKYIPLNELRNKYIKAIKILEILEL